MSKDTTGLVDVLRHCPAILDMLDSKTLGNLSAVSKSIHNFIVDHQIWRRRYMLGSFDRTLFLTDVHCAEKNLFNGTFNHNIYRTLNYKHEVRSKIKTTMVTQPLIAGVTVSQMMGLGDDNILLLLNKKSIVMVEKNLFLTGFIDCAFGAMFIDKNEIIHHFDIDKVSRIVVVRGNDFLATFSLQGFRLLQARALKLTSMKLLNGQQQVICGTKNSLVVLNLLDLSNLRILESTLTNPHILAMSSDWIVVSSPDSDVIKVWKFEEEQLVSTESLSFKNAKSALILRKVPSMLVLGNDESEAEIWSMANQGFYFSFRDVCGPVSFAQTKHLVMVGSSSNVDIYHVTPAPEVTVSLVCRLPLYKFPSKLDFLGVSIIDGQGLVSCHDNNRGYQTIIKFGLHF